jgi:hypothetical protein
MFIETSQLILLLNVISVTLSQMISPPGNVHNIYDPAKTFNSALSSISASKSVLYDSNNI